MAAGKYSSKVIWLQQSEVKDSNGTVLESFTPNGELWASIEAKDSQEVLEDERVKTVDSVLILVRNWIEISPKDRLQDKYWETVYKVTGVTYGNNEMIIKATT